MTLQNIRYLLTLNNREILKRIESLKYSFDILMATDVTKLQEQCKELDEMLGQAKLDIEKINDSSLMELAKRLDSIDVSIKNLTDKTSQMDTTLQTAVGDIKSLQEISTSLVKDLTEHIENATIHVTQADKDLWNSLLQTCNDYAKTLFDSVTSFTVKKVRVLPVDNIQTMTIYLLSITPEEDNIYDEYMYIDDKWERIGSTRINLDLYALKTDLHEHENQEVLNKLTDSDGNLLYNNKKISANVSQEDGNAIEQKEDGLYVPFVAIGGYTDEEVYNAVADILGKSSENTANLVSIQSMLDEINRVVIE